MSHSEPSKELDFFPASTSGRAGYADRVRQVFQKYLVEKNLIFTPQRSKILDHMLQADHHVSQEEIYKALKKEGIGKVTVFRTMKMLEECGLAERVTDSTGKARYEIEVDRPHHDHLICLNCGRIIEIQWPEVEKIQERISKKLGFTIAYHRHELFGTCHDCSLKK